MKVGEKAGCMGKIKCNNHEIKKVEVFKYWGSKMVTKRSVKEEITERLKNEKILPTIYRHSVEMPKMGHGYMLIITFTVWD